MADEDGRLLALADAPDASGGAALSDWLRQRRLQVVAVAAALALVLLWAAVRAVWSRPVAVPMPVVTQLAHATWPGNGSPAQVRAVDAPTSGVGGGLGAGPASSRISQAGVAVAPRPPVAGAAAATRATPGTPTAVTAVPACQPGSLTPGVDLNTATAAQLDGLPGVGPVLAQRIIAWRTAHRGFSDVHELQEVPGIGPSKYARLRGLVRLR